MGLCNLPFGLFGAGVFVVIPQLLAARHVSPAQIATITAFAIAPGFCSFAVSPLLDVFFSRRFYATLFGSLQAVFLFAAFAVTTNVTALSALLFCGFCCSALFNSALGGWLGSIAPPEVETKLGAWFTIANFTGFGISSAIGIPLLRSLPYTPASLVFCLIVVTPLAMLLRLPAPPPDRRLARESFGSFTRDVITLLRQPGSLKIMPLFVAPCATFALVNVVGALGADFRTPETVVSLAGGLCTTVGAIAGSFAAPSLARRVSLLWLYIGIGVGGSLFTLLVCALPKSTAMYLLAVSGENVFAAAAGATAIAIIFHAIGKANPLAATQFSVLSAAMFIPQIYMQAFDGLAYGHFGIDGLLLSDAVLSLLACATICLVSRDWFGSPTVNARPSI